MILLLISTLDDLSLSEKEIISALQNGEARAFEALVDQFQDKVYRSCLSHVPNSQEAQDIAQEVFVEVYQSIHKFEAKSTLSTWIYRITTNKCLEHLRKKKAKKRFGFMQSIGGGEIQEDKKAYLSDYNHPGAKMEAKERLSLLHRAVERLPESQRLVITLYYFEQKSQKEISEITDKSVSSIESLLFRAKKKLEDLLEPHRDELGKKKNE